MKDCTLDTTAPGEPVEDDDDMLLVMSHLWERRSRTLFDLIAPEGQSAGADVQNYFGSEACQHHGFVLLGGRKLGAHNVHLAGQCRGAGRADGGGAAELTGPVLVTENVRAGSDPGEAAQLDPTLWVVTQQGVVTQRHGVTVKSTVIT